MRQEEYEKTGVTYYVGLPVTSSALVFPLVMLVHLTCRWDLTMIYFLVMLVLAMAFVINVKVRKPGKVGLFVMIVIGLIELITILTAFIIY
jgi:CDP-diacylglycerol--serine O-phosphatidyltransferase